MAAIDITISCNTNSSNVKFNINTQDDCFSINGNNTTPNIPHTNESDFRRNAIKSIDCAVLHCVNRISQIIRYYQERTKRDFKLQSELANEKKGSKV